MKKGITPIIAIIILLLITVALAGVAWTFFQGYLYSMISGSFTIPTGGAYCIGGNISVMIMNTGQANITSGDITVARIDSSNLMPVTFNEIAPGKGDVVINDDNAGAGWPTGSHTVVVGTASTVLQTRVYCP